MYRHCLVLALSEMLAAIDKEVRRQINPFLEAGIQPDVILFENEASVGLLYNVTLPSGEMYSRGTGNNPYVSAYDLEQELCGHRPTGKSLSALWKENQALGLYMLASFFGVQVTTALAVQDITTLGVQVTTTLTLSKLDTTSKRF